MPRYTKKPTLKRVGFFCVTGRAVRGFAALRAYGTRLRRPLPSLMQTTNDKRGTLDFGHYTQKLHSEMQRTRLRFLPTLFLPLGILCTRYYALMRIANAERSLTIPHVSLCENKFPNFILDVLKRGKKRIR